MKTIFNIELAGATPALPQPPEAAMIVCHCRAITDREILAAAQSGLDAARDLLDDTRCRRCCGSCRSKIDAMLTQSLVTANHSGS